MKKRESKELKMRTEREKISDFVWRFFPTMGNTPGGTERLINLKKRIIFFDLNDSGHKRRNI